MKEDLDNVHQGFDSEIKKLTQQIQDMRLQAASDIEAKLEEATGKFDELLKKAEEELNAITTEGDDNELKQKVEKVFLVDKNTHEALQQVISQVEQDQINLNQARMALAQEKKIYDKPLDEKMTSFHNKCDAKITELENQRKELVQQQCAALEEEMNKTLAQFKEVVEKAAAEIDAQQIENKDETELRNIMNTIIENDSQVCSELQGIAGQVESKIIQIRQL